MKTIVTSFQAFCGDCILVSFQQEYETQTRHIIIDAGYAQTYHRTLSKAVQKIVDNMERISLFVLTHIDNDHLGGVVPFIKEFSDGIVDAFWMNHSPSEIIVTSGGPIGVKQGITLRDLLATGQKLNSEPIIAGQIHKIDNVNLFILSPDFDQHNRFLEKWEAQEKTLQQQKKSISSGLKDHNLSIDLLVQNLFNPDTSWRNRSSIAFLLFVGEFTGLFTGDAHADVVINSLKEMGYSHHNPITLSLFKVSHHGSKGNTNEELLQLVDCQHYLISTNGANQHQLPHKEALARIVKAAHQRHPTVPIHLYFTYNDSILQSLFTLQEIEQYNICCHYPSNYENSISIIYHDS